MNEDELRKLVREYHSWSNQKTREDANFRFGTRKNFLIKLFCRLSSKLGNLFNSFYGYIFDSLLEDLDQMFDTFKAKKSKFANKR